MNWEEFLEDNNIGYVTRGPNTKHGEISIRCPWCGDDDPSEHLGISLGSDNWGCHRNSDHRGKSSVYLVQALLGCSHRQATLSVAQYNRGDPDDLESAIAALSDDEVPIEASTQDAGPVELPHGVRDIGTRPASIVRFWNYLHGRGFGKPQYIIDRFELKACVLGRFKDRIIIPIKAHGELVGWTARAITPVQNAPRYLTSSDAVKGTIFNLDEVMKGGETLLITEGPLDAIKCQHCIHSLALDGYNVVTDKGPVVPTCTFGTTVSMSQMFLLRSVVKKYRKAVILFDDKAESEANKLQDWIGGVIGRLPEGVEDPGDMRLRDFKKGIETEWGRGWTFLGAKNRY